MQEPEKLVEAALFISPEPLGLEELAKILDSGSIGQVRKTVNKLAKEYAEKDSSLEIVEFENRYRMKIKDKYLPRVANLAVNTEFTRPVLKTLAIIAFHQPMKQSELVKIRGSGVYEHNHDLLKAGLIKSEKSGRTRVLTTTKKFEDYFGTSIESLKKSYGEIKQQIESSEAAQQTLSSEEETSKVPEEKSQETQSSGETLQDEEEPEEVVEEPGEENGEEAGEELSEEDKMLSEFQ